MKRKERRYDVPMPEGLKFALIAKAFFRSRCEMVPRFKRPKQRWNARQTTPVYRRYVYLARTYIKKAREAGFRGSINEQTAELWRLRNASPAIHTSSGTRDSIS